VARPPRHGRSFASITDVSGRIRLAACDSPREGALSQCIVAPLPSTPTFPTREQRIEHRLHLARLIGEANWCIVQITPDLNSRLFQLQDRGGCTNGVAADA